MNRRSILLVAVLSLLGCNAEPALQVEAWRGDTWDPVATSDYSIDGARDGASTTAILHFTIAGQARLEVTLQLSYDPTPILSAGSWQIDGEAGGGVRAESLDFVGGQGEGPSVGGIFVLETDGLPRYRLKLPLTAVAEPRWAPQ